MKNLSRRELLCRGAVAVGSAGILGGRGVAAGALPQVQRRAGAMQVETDGKDTAVQQLRSALRGALVRRGDPDYEAARQVWNGAVNRHPAMIAYCTGVTDVLT